MYSRYLTLLMVWTPAMFAAEEKRLAGWPGVFPIVAGYECTFDAPDIGKDSTKEYRQTARYEWTGAVPRSIKATLARGPNVADMPDKGAEAVEVGKRKGWFKDGVLTIVLGEDRVKTMETGGLVEGKEGALDLLPAFPLERIAKLLDKAPRTERKPDLDAFRAVTKEMTYPQLVQWVGESNENIGSGIHIMVYPLADGGKVMVGTSDLLGVLYIKHKSKDGEVEDLKRE